MYSKKDIIFAFLIASISSILLLRNILILPNHWDESYPVGLYWRYEKLFINHDFSPRDWVVEKDVHPPMINYVVGIVLDWTGYSKLIEKGYFARPVINLGNDIFMNLKDPSIATYFLIGRLTMAFFAIVSLVLLYVVLRKIFAPVPSTTAVLLIGTNPLFLQVAPRLFLEAVQGFFLVGSLFFLVKWAKEKRLRNQVSFIILTGIFSAFCYMTKINGLLALLASLICLIVFLSLKKTTLGHFVTLATALILSFFVTATVIFPPFLGKPIELHRDLFLWRLETTQERQKQTPHYTIWQKEKYRPLEAEPVTWGGKIDGIGEGTVMVSYRMLWYFDQARRILKFPLQLVLVLIATTEVILNRLKGKSAGNIILVTWSISIIFISLLVLMQDVDRYYYLLLFPQSVFLAIGLERAQQICKPIFFKLKSKTNSTSPSTRTTDQR